MDKDKHGEIVFVFIMAFIGSVGLGLWTSNIGAALFAFPMFIYLALVVDKR